MDRDAYFWQVIDGKLPPANMATTLGARIVNIDAEAGTLVMECDVGKQFLNMGGMVHGGILATILDETMGMTLGAMLAAKEVVPTINLNVQYFSVARTGPMVCKGRVERRGKGICHMSGELLQQGKVVAKATAVAALLKLEGVVAELRVE